MLSQDKPRVVTIAVVMGTRPEAIKLAPVVRALRSESWARTLVVGVRQHQELLDQALAEADIGLDVDLEIEREGSSLTELAARLLAALDGWLELAAPDAVLVQGDTTTALTVALAAFYRHIPSAHVEAGLRSGDVRAPFPEEANRRMIASLATWHFAPTEKNRDNLLREGAAPEAVVVTGNTIVDALRWTLARDGAAPHADGRLLLVVSLHRREGLGEPQHKVARAVRRIALAHPEIDVWLPLQRRANRCWRNWVRCRTSCWPSRSATASSFAA
jgi:UDP-N-acetylglucosamine 2-epimerase (non-hydrolysing)